MCKTFSKGIAVRYPFRTTVRSAYPSAYPPAETHDSSERIPQRRPTRVSFIAFVPNLFDCPYLQGDEKRDWEDPHRSGNRGTGARAVSWSAHTPAHTQTHQLDLSGGPRAFSPPAHSPRRIPRALSKAFTGVQGGLVQAHRPGSHGASLLEQPRVFMANHTSRRIATGRNARQFVAHTPAHRLQVNRHLGAHTPAHTFGS